MYIHKQKRPIDHQTLEANLIEVNSYKKKTLLAQKLRFFVIPKD